MAEQAHAKKEPYLTGPRKKGIRSIAYGAFVGAGWLIGGPIGTITVGAASIYSAIKGFSSVKKAISAYKSTKDYVNEKAESYLGKGLSYLGRAAATIAFPWLIPISSSTAGAARLNNNDYLERLDYHELSLFEKEEKVKAEKAAAEKMRKEEEEKGKKDK